jgi:hypothetical protein
MQQSQAVVDCSSVPAAQPGSDIKQFVSIARDVLNIFGAASSKNGFGVANGIIAFVMDSIYGGGSDISGAITQIKQELDCVATGLDWKVTALAWIDDQLGPVETAYMDLAHGFPIGSIDDVDSHQGTWESGQLPMFERTFVPSSTDGDGIWKGIISNHDPVLVDPGQVFDWRFGFPRFMSLIGKRITIIANLDPEFITNGTWNGELEGTAGDPGYRLLLQQRLQQMLSGVRCGKADRFKTVTDPITRRSDTTYLHTDIACADVNTGLSTVDQHTLEGTGACVISDIRGSHYDLACLANLADQQSVASTMDSLRRSLLSQMPIFEVQSMIDVLYHFTHPALDLTEALGRIPASGDVGTCLDVFNGDPTPGTAVWLYWCTWSVAQQWSYDRKLQTLTNTAFGKCLEVKPFHIVFPPWIDFFLDNRLPGAPAVTADCISPPPLRQQWSYDPEVGVLRSAVGTVLEIQGGSVQPTNSVLMGDYSGEITQQWHAD